MTAYIEGYRAGWTSYVNRCQNPETAVEQLLAQVHTLAEQAGLGVSDTQQRDFWLGYHHGRTAARAAVAQRRDRAS